LQGTGKREGGDRMKFNYSSIILLFNMWLAVMLGEFDIELFWIVLNCPWIKRNSKEEYMILAKRIDELKPFIE
jgi:hypothetical protein